MTRDINRRVLFDCVAELYQSARPNYPMELIDDVINQSGIPPKGRIMEIGAGAGQATRQFAERGYRIISLELGENLAKIAAEAVKEYPNAIVVNTAFEDYELAIETFDLVISASAFHWIPDDIGLTKSACALKANGWIALFWNHRPKKKQPNNSVHFAVEEVHKRFNPDSSSPSFVDHSQEIRKSGLFDEPVSTKYPWSRVLTAQEYADLSLTYSGILSLPADTRTAFHADLINIVNVHGGYIELYYESELYMARKR